MDFIDILGYNMRFIKFCRPESRKTIVLLHGLGASAERWSALWPLLDKYNVVIPDLIGF